MKPHIFLILKYNFVLSPTFLYVMHRTFGSNEPIFYTDFRFLSDYRIIATTLTKTYVATISIYIRTYMILQYKYNGRSDL
jgi:hypothetical protein